MGDYQGRGFRLHFVEEGDGEAVVFLHGFLMDHTMFAPQFEDLPDHYRCIAWDMRGHGQSEHPDAPWTVDEIASDAIAFIEHLEAGPCHLVGMSIGGMIALRVALRRPDLVSSLVLIDTSADAEEEASIAQYRTFQDAIAAQGLQDDLIHLTLPVFYGRRYREEETDGIQVHFARVREMSTTSLVTTLGALIERESVVSRLGDITVPCLVLHGTEDAAIAMTKAEQLRDAMQAANLVTIEGAGHTPPLEAPDRVNELLGAFLASTA